MGQFNDDKRRAFGLCLHSAICAIYIRTCAGLTAFSGEENWILPMSARDVIGQDSVIAYAEVNPDYTTPSC